MARPYDYLIVGAGLAGLVLSRELTDAGKKVLLIDKRSYIGGNIHCDDMDGITVHSHGAHIIHTDNREVWAYIRQFVSMNGFINTPIAVSGNAVYNLPLNMNTFSRLFGIRSPQEAQDQINSDCVPCEEPSNLEDYLLNIVGRRIYYTLLKGYTEKQWGHSCRELPISVMRRIPIRYTYNNSYYNQRWQGVPDQGYNDLAAQLADGAEVVLNQDYLPDQRFLDSLADRVIYTGAVDELYRYSLGHLEYRSLDFETVRIDCNNLMGVAVTNFTDSDVPYTRVIEHKHFTFGDDRPYTVISYEKPSAFDGTNIPYYPVCIDKNIALYQKYAKMALEQGYVLCGRLAEYKYHDMSDTILSALRTSKALLKKG